MVNGQHLIRARWLLRHGQSRQARKELRLAGGGPLSHRMLAALPGPVTWGVLGLRQALRGERPSASDAERLREAVGQLWHQRAAVRAQLSGTMAEYQRRAFKAAQCVEKAIAYRKQA